MDQQLDVNFYKRRPEHMKMDCVPSKRAALDTFEGSSEGEGTAGGTGGDQIGAGQHTCRLEVDGDGGDDEVGGVNLGVHNLYAVRSFQGVHDFQEVRDFQGAQGTALEVGGAALGGDKDFGVLEFGDVLVDEAASFSGGTTDQGGSATLQGGSALQGGSGVKPLTLSRMEAAASTANDVQSGLGVEGGPVGASTDEGTGVSGVRVLASAIAPQGADHLYGVQGLSRGVQGGALESSRESGGALLVDGYTTTNGNVALADGYAPVAAGVQGGTLDSLEVGNAALAAFTTQEVEDGTSTANRASENVASVPSLVLGTLTAADNVVASSLAVGSSLTVGTATNSLAVGSATCNVVNSVGVEDYDDIQLDISVGTQNQSHLESSNDDEDDHHHHGDADQDYSVTGGFVQHSQLFEGFTSGDTLAAHGNTGASASTSGGPRVQVPAVHSQSQLQPPGQQQQVMLYHQPIVDRSISNLARPSSRGSIDIASDCGDVKRQIIGDENLTNSILKELVCPICLEYFYFPVTVSCGHTYCRYCIGHAKLAGKLCPLCRQPVGKTLNINTILSSLVKILKLRKRTIPVQRGPEMTRAAEKLWWDEHCLKPFVSMPLFLRIMFGDVIQSPVFFDDLCTCLLDYFSSYNKWSKCKWIFTIDDCREVRRLVGFDHGDPEGTFTRLHNFVEDYLMANPHLSFRVDPSYPILLKVYHDFTHKIDGTVFSALDIQHKLPWDVGRHAKSLLHLPHSSVSLSHLLFAQCPRGEIGLLDVGSTIGTMLKLQQVYALQDGDRIHVGDKHEVDIKIVRRAGGSFGASATREGGSGVKPLTLSRMEAAASTANDVQSGLGVEGGPVGASTDEGTGVSGVRVLASAIAPQGADHLYGVQGLSRGVQGGALESSRESGGALLVDGYTTTNVNVALADGHAPVGSAAMDNYAHFKWDPCTNQVLSPSQIETLDADSLAQLEPIESTLWMTVHADQSQVQVAQVPPKGLVVGRGPTVTGDYTKLSITTQNGYISREHCLLFYDGSQPFGKRWLLRDMSTLGTFLKLKPFQEPTPIKPGQLFKVGQCKVEVCDANDVNKRVPSPAAIILSQLLQSHLQNAQGQSLQPQPQGQGHVTSSERDLN